MAPWAVNSTVQFSGSIGAWARYGKTNSASIVFEAWASGAMSASKWRGPGCAASARYWASWRVLSTFSTALVSQSSFSAWRACWAGQ